MKPIRIFSCLLFLVCAAVSRAATTFDFVQEGFAGGATVSGSFVAEDRNGNGQISSLDGEVVDFRFRFSGNSIVAAFAAGLSDLRIFFLVWDLDDPVLGDGTTGDVEGIWAQLQDGTKYLAGEAPSFFPAPAGAMSTQSNLLSITDSPVRVHARPEPVPSGGATVVMLGMALAALGAGRRLVR